VIKANSEELPYEVRIVKSADYRMLYKVGKKVYSERFVLFWRKNEIGHHRLGITVSRKTGNAVIRNRIKRLLREIFRKNFRMIPGQFDLVINARPGCGEAKYKELLQEFLNAIRRVGKKK
jgi:ribonuclease P protein component